MADEEPVEGEESSGKKKRGGLIIGLVLALAGGGGGFAFTSGMIGGGGDSHGKVAHASLGDDLAFVPVEPMTVSIGDPSERRHLRFRAELEVDSDVRSDVEKLM
ncbi:MAG: flagellar basal body protein FliL, partial [Silicimonas sp.]|nr:flagellar basal body protein FliL [Silicimonas sp.]